MNLEEMVANPNHCDKCDTELEVDQIGLCGDCIEEKTYTFAELSDKAKQHAREEYTGEGYLDYDWWDGVYEDAARMAALLGLDIMSTRMGKTKIVKYADINFSGFCSQGDGACFRGSYRFNPEAVVKVTAETNDKELIRIATGLYTLQLARRLHGFAPFSATITTSGRYSHSHTMSVEVNLGGEEEYPTEALENEVEQLMRDFADHIYGVLETEYEYLMSDECVDAALVDEKFDEDGSVI